MNSLGSCFQLDGGTQALATHNPETTRAHSIRTEQKVKAHFQRSHARLGIAQWLNAQRAYSRPWV